MTQLSLHPGFGWLALMAVGVTASVLVIVFYRRAFPALKPGRWRRLVALRLLAIAIILLLLFRPVVSHQQAVSEKRVVAFLVDQSASMGVADDPGGATRWEHATDKLLSWLEQLQPDFETEVAAFSDVALPLETREALVALQANGASTSLSRALMTADQIKGARELEAVILLSDGLHNSAVDPVATASKLGVPVYAIGLGSALQDSKSARDVRIADLDVPEQMPVDNLARVAAYVDATGYPGQVTSAVLEEDGRQVAERELVLDGVDGTQEVTFEFTPTVKGLHRYTVRTPPISGEKIPENNVRSGSSLVIESRIRVLYVEGTLRAEYGAMVGQFLSKDPNIEFCALVQTRPNVFMQRSNIEDLQLTTIPNDDETIDSFDVFIIGDLDSSYWQPGQMERVSQRVLAGAGFLMTGGYHSLGPGGYQGTEVEKLLPVFVGDREVGQIDDPFQLRLTPDGRQHPIFANIWQFFPLQDAAAEIEGLPELQGAVRVAGIKPAATVLAIHPLAMTTDNAPMPLLAVQPIGSGRSAVFTGDTTRNWQQSMRALDRETPFLRFWGQTVRWLAGRSDEVLTTAGIVATTDKIYYEPGSPVIISAVVRGPEGKATGDATVSAAVTGPNEETETLTLAPAAGPAGNYRIVFEPQQTGRYAINVAAPLPSGLLNADPLAIDVGRPNLEFDTLALDQKMLAAIAQASGGRYAHISTADRLIDQLQRGHHSRLVQYEVKLYWPPLMWLAFVGVLTSEWILRRKYQLR